MNREQAWQENYARLKDYIIAFHHLPDKHKVENRGLLNWWKYQMKLKKKDALPAEKVEMLDTLAGMRSTEHTGGWPKGKKRG